MRTADHYQPIERQLIEAGECAYQVDATKHFDLLAQYCRASVGVSEVYCAHHELTLEDFYPDQYPPVGGWCAYRPTIVFEGDDDGE